MDCLVISNPAVHSALGGDISKQSLQSQISTLQMQLAECREENLSLQFRITDMKENINNLQKENDKLNDRMHACKCCSDH